MKSYMNVIKNYANFSGRARREEYWLFWLTNLVIQIVLMTIDGAVGTGQAFFLIYSLLVFLPSLAVTVRRLHDSSRSGWWILIALIPVIGAIAGLYFMVVDSTPGKNEYGPNPKGITA
ncbi:DUF805 domain-containing protein [Photobacterium galatheae]|uniref:Membrane protein n=1 Tax=Photobacterium galatheae TaxID=1654360 RepID=A0A066RT11_9GAMM|nr:DUF805 domain-containing protein [Photobacterium galatheae]KDM92211.1 membrane protein [Photobacterium galatheae]MCM0150609.1 DUF805 domain-containing protein [Photobacterium galatheae]